MLARCIWNCTLRWMEVHWKELIMIYFRLGSFSWTTSVLRNVFFSHNRNLRILPQDEIRLNFLWYNFLNWLWKLTLKNNATVIFVIKKSRNVYAKWGKKKRIWKSYFIMHKRAKQIFWTLSLSPWNWFHL